MAAEYNENSDFSGETGDAFRKPRQSKLARSEGQRASGATERVRNVFSGNQAKLQVPASQLDPGYHYHWINDTPGRIEQAIAGGYEFVNRSDISLAPGVINRSSDVGDHISTTVGSSESNEPMRGYLMRIRLDWYEENQMAGQERCDQMDATITQGRVSTANPADQKAFYTPSGHRNRIERK